MHTGPCIPPRPEYVLLGLAVDEGVPACFGGTALDMVERGGERVDVDVADGVGLVVVG
jgi:hypothetical protein